MQKPSSLKHLLTPLIFVLAVVLVFEEWLWEYFKRQLHRLSHLPWVAATEKALRSLAPLPSLCLMILPILILLPFKILALYALAHGYRFLGVLVFILAKLTGTAMGAYLFDLVRPQARKIPWFDRFYSDLIALIQRAKAWLHAQPLYVRTQRGMHQLKLKISVSLGKNNELKQQIRAAKSRFRK